MARYKHIDTSPGFLAVDLQQQLLPDTFEHAMNHLIDTELDLSDFDAHFNNNVAAFNSSLSLRFLRFFC